VFDKEDTGVVVNGPGEALPGYELSDPGGGLRDEDVTLPKGFFVTGTDTGVGKTIVAAALIRAIALVGLSVCGMKPVETGCRKEGDELVASDGIFLREVSGVGESMEMVSPFRYGLPVAPMVAAEKEGAEVDVEGILTRYGELSARYDAMVVEGVGGLLVPLRKDYFVSDLASDLRLPLIIVSSPFLGTINHTLLTVRLAVELGLDVAGIVMNYYRSPEGSLAEETNPQVIKRLSPVPLVGVMPYLEDLSPEALEAAVTGHLDMDIITGRL
jgi:dethiobiotin synthetase